MCARARDIRRLRAQPSGSVSTSVDTVSPPYPARTRVQQRVFPYNSVINHGTVYNVADYGDYPFARERERARTARVPAVMTEFRARYPARVAFFIPIAETRRDG